LGFQGKAQLEYIYGHLAEVMLSQPATNIWLKTKEPKAGQWVSESIGKVEIERMRETHFDGSRSGRNFSLDRQEEPLVMESEISGLEDLHAFMKHQQFCDALFISVSGCAQHKDSIRAARTAR
jgi:type IV secretory pathway TraG/TraD family ATPase VirD4